MKGIDGIRIFLSNGESKEVMPSDPGDILKTSTYHLNSPHSISKIALRIKAGYSDVYGIKISDFEGDKVISENP